MPELPEAERARALVELHGLNRRIAAVEDSDTYVCRPHAPNEMAEALTGHRLVSARRRGKSMWFETDGGPTLYLHLGMAGRLLLDEEPHEPWDRFALQFEDGGRLALRDKRPRGARSGPGSGRA
jgi:formamidopyrimidine-DNA glycosylase